LFRVIEKGMLSRSLCSRGPAHKITMAFSVQNFEALTHIERRESMRAVVQRVSRARVVVDGCVTGEIRTGVAVLIAVGREDGPATATSMAEKTVNLRIFNDDAGKMNRSLLDVGGAVLAVSQFTLYGDARGQRRPSFIQAAPPEQGKAVYEEFVRALRALGVHVETGVFQAHMSVELTNDGPVTILLDSDKLF
jgi:D-tyrosyl-tRNA(Tyr) deacylase